MRGGGLNVAEQAMATVSIEAHRCTSRNGPTRESASIDRHRNWTISRSTSMSSYWVAELLFRAVDHLGQSMLHLWDSMYFAWLSIRTFMMKMSLYYYNNSTCTHLGSATFLRHIDTTAKTLDRLPRTKAQRDTFS